MKPTTSRGAGSSKEVSHARRDASPPSLPPLLPLRDEMIIKYLNYFDRRIPQGRDMSGPEWVSLNRRNLDVFSENDLESLATLADANRSGSLSRGEFVIALHFLDHLWRLKVRRGEVAAHLPRELPLWLKAVAVGIDQGCGPGPTPMSVEKAIPQTLSRHHRTDHSGSAGICPCPRDDSPPLMLVDADNDTGHASSPDLEVSLEQPLQATHPRYGLDLLSDPPPSYEDNKINHQHPQSPFQSHQTGEKAKYRPQHF